MLTHRAPDDGVDAVGADDRVEDLLRPVLWPADMKLTPRASALLDFAVEKLGGYGRADASVVPGASEEVTGSVPG